MSKNLKHVALFSAPPEYHSDPQKIATHLKKLIQYLEHKSIQITLHRFILDYLPELDLKYPTQKLSELNQNKLNALISIGGDGTLLRAGRKLSKNNIPIIGMNTGHLGFLTDISPDKLEQDLQPILNGSYHQSDRILLEGIYKNYSPINALNDIVLFPGQAAQLIEFELFINNNLVYKQRADGLIISTPTGSTAYNLSAGGPIIEPDSNVITITPKAPHSLSCRPLIIPSDNKIELKIANYKNQKPRISFDGHHDIELDINETILIQQQTQKLRLLHPKNHNYFDALRAKLFWSKGY